MSNVIKVMLNHFWLFSAVTETPSVLTESTSVSLKEDDDHSSSFLNGNELATNKDEEVGYGNETELPVIEDNRNSTVSVDSQSQESTSSVTEGLAKEFHVTTDEPSTNGSYEVTTEVDTATQKVLLDSGVSDEAGGERTPQPEISHITSSEETAKTTNVNILNDKEHESTSSSIAETAETTDSTVKGLHSVDSKVHFSTVSVNHRIELTTELEPIYSSSESPLNGDSDDSVSVTMEHKLEISNHSLSIPGNASEIGYQEETITLYPEIDDEGSNVLATDSVTSHVITSLPTTASEGHSQESDSYSTPSAKVSLDVVTSSENDVVVTASEPAVAAIAEFTTPSVLKYDQTAFAEQTDKPILNDEERQTHSLVPLQDATTSDVGTTEELQTFIPVEKETTIDAQRSTSLPYIPLEHDKDKEITAAPEPEKGSLEPESSSSLPKVEIGSEAPQDLDDSTSEKKHPNTESSTIKDLEGIPGEGNSE